LSTPSLTPAFASVEEALARLEATGYLASREIATCAFLADRMQKPVLVEGPAGVGKTEFGRALGRALGRPVIHLQCYEGLDEAKALYEWEYAKQLLYTQLLKDKIGETLQGAQTLGEAADRIAKSDAVFFSERFLVPRPILRALLSVEPALLLVDEVDKADPEFEAFLLEVLADNAVTIPELGTLRATAVPRVVLTSNAARELSDALKRRCLHLHIDFPSRERELRIVRARFPHLPAKLAESVVSAVAKLRDMELKKPPSISETLDWAQSLVLLNADVLTPELVASTLNVVLKYESDAERARPQAPQLAQA
jgi:MoxR-like ATPase